MKDPKILKGIKALTGARFVIPHDKHPHFAGGHEHATDRAIHTDEAEDRYAIGLDGRHVHALDEQGNYFQIPRVLAEDAAERIDAGKPVTQIKPHKPLPHPPKVSDAQPSV